MPQPQQSPFPPIPAEPVQEGGRWRHHRPTSEQVAQWFQTQPLDEGMEHPHYVGGVVIIPGSEKVKYAKRDGLGTVERYEQTFVPYMQIGTRVAYFRHLAERRGVIMVSKAAEVPRTNNPQSAYFNGNMPEGLWWHIVQGNDGPVRYLCSTWRVALYETTSYARLLKGEEPMPLLEGTGTKQVGGFPDINMIAKAQTGSLGRALGVAGILVVGTGIATAEDMQEYAGEAGAAQAAPELPLVPSAIQPGEEPPPPTDPAEQLARLRSRALALQTQLQELQTGSQEGPWSEFVTWWQERKRFEGWDKLEDVPLEGLKAVIAKMESELANAAATSVPS